MENKESTTKSETQTQPEATRKPEAAATAAQPEIRAPQEIKEHYLAMGKNDRPLQIVDNWNIVLDHDADFSGVCHDDFLNGICLLGPAPWDPGNVYRGWEDRDDAAVYARIQKTYGLRSRQDMRDALTLASAGRHYHPIRAALEALEYRGGGFVRRLLPEFLGAEDNEYTAQVMRLWMLGAVARVYEPGCKFDYAIVLQGAQGIGKSTFLRKLALSDDYFSDSLKSLDTEAAEQLLGTWICELPELRALARTTTGFDGVKAFLSATQDRIRLKYERRTRVFRRQAAFALTTNDETFLDDVTGARRFLIVPVGKHGGKGVFNGDFTDAVKGAWAEILHIYRTEKPALILPGQCAAEAQRLQDGAQIDDMMAAPIADYLKGKKQTCILQIWLECLNESGRPNAKQKKEIANIILHADGWRKSDKPLYFGGPYKTQRGFIKG